MQRASIAQALYRPTQPPGHRRRRGGEPTLAVLEYFCRSMASPVQSAKPGTRVRTPLGQRSPGCRVGAGSFTTTPSRSANWGGPKGHRGGYRKDREGPGNVRTRSPDPTIATGLVSRTPRDAAHGRPRPPEPPRREGRENGPGRPLLPRNRGRSGRGGMRTNCYIRQQCRSIPNWREPWHTQRPNILILWGDDIGWWNISYNSRGQMGYRTPNIDRIANEGVAFTDYYGQQSCTAGRARLHHRPEPDPHRPDQGRHARRRRRPAGGGPDHRRAAQAARLRHRPVRQEPPRRQGRVPADRARLRRVLRQPLPPQRRGGAGGPRLPEGPGVQEAVRPARRAPLLGRRQGRAEDRGHRPADQEAHGDHRRRGHRARARASSTRRRPRPSKPFFLWCNTTAMHFRTHRRREAQGQERARATTTT